MVLYDTEQHQYSNGFLNQHENGKERLFLSQKERVMNGEVIMLLENEFKQVITEKIITAVKIFPTK